MELKFRDLRADEIEVRVGSTTKDKSGEVVSFGLLLYKTARVDANILDETVGVFNWQKKFYQVKNTMICSIGIWCEERKEWVWKDDGGDDDFTTEQVKAECSDSTKRSGFVWSIGRKLYSASKIYMRVDKTPTNTEKSYYQVDEIEYDDTSITKLVISNKKTKEVVINYNGKSKVSKNTVSTPTNAKGTIKPEDKKFIIDYIGRLSGDNYTTFVDKIRTTFKVEEVSEMSAEQGAILVRRLKKNA